VKLEEVQALSDEALRIKVAEFCGWVREDRPMIHPVQVTEGLAFEGRVYAQ